ncbi:Galactan beta-1,4-galactosyltransferase GALS2 [Clarias magur]|uniref:Galactan beta-1,4-galactosyltransferase GALS2 n=1 Tax=Clarias magur TaxID=1594786 RepID=A0A8J4U8U0_CLAMG|nr:Galactan beta-1,4-galactosyltransferase GALS2 [Clarias magur]
MTAEVRTEPRLGSHMSQELRGQTRNPAKVSGKNIFSSGSSKAKIDPDRHLSFPEGLYGSAEIIPKRSDFKQKSGPMRAV